jgi:hypothetical protein
MHVAGTEATPEGRRRLEETLRGSTRRPLLGTWKGHTWLIGQATGNSVQLMERKHFEVRSAYNAKLFRCDRPWAAISITTEGDFPALSEDNRLGLLQLVFADTADPDRTDSFTASQAAELLSFVEQVWDRVEVLLIHCEVGMSRSPGVAAALSQINYGDDGPWGEYDFPNSLVYQRLVDGHQQRCATK